MQDSGDVMQLGDPPARGAFAYVDLAAFDDEGQPLNVWPCRFCETWHVQVVDEGSVSVREWHAETCAHYLAITAEMSEH